MGGRRAASHSTLPAPRPEFQQQEHRRAVESCRPRRRLHPQCQSGKLKCTPVCYKQIYLLLNYFRVTLRITFISSNNSSSQVATSIVLVGHSSSSYMSSNNNKCRNLSRSMSSRFNSCRPTITKIIPILSPHLLPHPHSRISIRRPCQLKRNRQLLHC